MAGDWIKMRVDLATSPKVVRIASALRADRLRVIGGLHAVWCLFDVHSTDGRLDGYTLEALDDLIGFPGFGAAMATVGWLEDDGESLCTPRFDEHNGQSAKRRAMETERKREARKVSAPDADKVRSREEKRREDTSSLRSEVEPASPQRGSRLPTDWQLPDEWATWATQTRPDLNPLETAQRFSDYWHGVAGAKGRKADWLATWRNWVRNEKHVVRQPQARAESFYERDKRLKAQEVAKFAPGIAAKAPAGFDFIEGGVSDVTAIESN
jgi:hypothetical protein